MQSMVIDQILDLFFSLVGGVDLLYFLCALIIISSIMAAIVQRFQNV